MGKTGKSRFKNIFILFQGNRYGGNYVDLLNKILPKKQPKEHTLGVCIPDASKRNIAKKAEEQQPSGYGFLVSGIFHVQDSIMIKGTALSGTIKQNDKTSFNGLNFEVESIQLDNKDVESLENGQKGALFLKPKDGKFPIIKAGDMLEF